MIVINVFIWFLVIGFIFGNSKVVRIIVGNRLMIVIIEIEIVIRFIFFICLVKVEGMDFFLVMCKINRGGRVIRNK